MELDKPYEELPAGWMAEELGEVYEELPADQIAREDGGGFRGSAWWLKDQGLWRFMRSCPTAGWQRGGKMGLKASGE